MGTKSEQSGNKVEAKWEQEPQSGTRMEAKWEQSGKRNPKVVFLNLDKTSIQTKIKKENYRGCFTYVAIICIGTKLQGKLSYLYRYQASRQIVLLFTRQSNSSDQSGHAKPSSLTSNHPCLWNSYHPNTISSVVENYEKISFVEATTSTFFSQHDPIGAPTSLPMLRIWANSGIAITSFEPAENNKLYENLQMLDVSASVSRAC